MLAAIAEAACSSIETLVDNAPSRHVRWRNSRMSVHSSIFIVHLGLMPTQEPQPLIGRGNQMQARTLNNRMKGRAMAPTKLLRTNGSIVRLIVIALFCSLLSVGLLLTGVANIAQAAPARTATGPLMPSGDKVLLGVSIDPWGRMLSGETFGSNDTRLRIEAEHQRQIGRDTHMVNEFFRFDLPWSSKRAVFEQQLAENKLIMITWNGTYADILLDENNPQHDTYMGYVDANIAFAKEMFPETPFFLRFFHEMDAKKGATWGYHSDPTKFHQVWRMIRQRFEDAGVTNAVWVFAPTAWHFNPGTGVAAQDFYPGDDVVDWVGADGYMMYPSPCGPSQYRATEDEFNDIYRAFFQWADPLNKPIMIPEWGANASTPELMAINGDSQLKFIESAPQALVDHPNVGALVYYDNLREDEGCDWRLDRAAPDNNGDGLPDSVLLDAYREMVSDPKFDVDLATLPGIAPDVDPPADPQPEPAEILFVTREASLTPGDYGILDLLAEEGHNVTIANDQGISARRAEGKDLVLISSGVSSRYVSDTFNDVTIPVLTWKPWLLDDLGLTGRSTGSYGSTPAQDVNIVDSDHPAAAGLTGTVTMSTSKRISYGVPVAGAEVVANLAGAEKPSLFFVPTGTTLTDGSQAPACRGLLPLFHNTGNGMTPEGRELIAASVTYALDGC